MEVITSASDVEFVPQLGRVAPTTDVPPSTRRSDFWRSAAAYNTNIMSEQKKQERDYTPEVDALLTEVDVLVKVTSFDFNSISCAQRLKCAGWQFTGRSG
jgi:hypothetical protein